MLPELNCSRCERSSFKSAFVNVLYETSTANMADISAYYLCEDCFREFKMWILEVKYGTD